MIFIPKKEDCVTWNQVEDGTVYINNGKIKVELALAKGKKYYDKRNSLKEKDVKKEIKRYL